MEREDKPMTYSIPIFHKTLVVATETNQKQYTSDVLKTMYPLSSFTLLTTHIDHEHFMILELKCSFGDTDCSCTALNDVLFRWFVRFVEQTIQFWEEVGHTVDDGNRMRHYDQS